MSNFKELPGGTEMSEIYGWLTPKDKFEESQRFDHNNSPSIQDLWEELG